MAQVYFLDLRKKYRDSVLEMFVKLITTADGMKILKDNTSCPVKLHFGEDGNMTFVNPLYVRTLLDHIKQRGGRPFLTDTTTLYSGRRFRADTHIELAREHGFDFAPIIIADGFYGDEYEEVNGSKIARLFSDIEMFFCVSHFKGHLLTGFGGTLKNLAMGCASKGGKLTMHSNSKPFIDRAKCTFCLKCVEYCAFHAIKKSKKTVTIDHSVCTGCAGCMSICPERAIKFSWNAASSDVAQRIARYAADVIKDKNVFYISFLINISPNCDCFHTNEPMIAPDVGILASFDPVSLDQACYDFVKKPIDDLYPDVNAALQLEYAEQCGAGERTYEIREI
jgi:hypothetical protein